MIIILYIKVTMDCISTVSYTHLPLFYTTRHTCYLWVKQFCQRVHRCCHFFTFVVFINQWMTCVFSGWSVGILQAGLDIVDITYSLCAHGPYLYYVVEISSVILSDQSVWEQECIIYESCVGCILWRCDRNFLDLLFIWPDVIHVSKPPHRLSYKQSQAFRVALTNYCLLYTSRCV